MDKQTDPKYKTMPRYSILFSYPMDLADKSSANYTVTGIMILLNAQLNFVISVPLMRKLRYFG